MKTAAFLFLAIGSLLTRDTLGDPLTPAPATTPDFSGWTPTCTDPTGTSPSLTLPANNNFTGFYTVLISPKTCQNIPTFTDFPTKPVTTNCLETDKSITLSFQPSGRNFAGGHIFTEVKITCKDLDDNGHSLTATIKVTVKDGPGASVAMTAQPSLSPLTMKLVTGTGTATSAPPTFTLGQPDVHLIISGASTYFLIPTNCRGTSDPPALTKTYTFFKAESTCAVDDEVLGTFNMDTKGTARADFYPFMFTSGGSITLTCEVRVCPDPLGGTCQTTKNTITGTCTKGPVTQTPAGRRRRSARESEPDTHVVEVTYTIVSNDPALHGQTAAGAGMAVSIPLLAAVASLWIL